VVVAIVAVPVNDAGRYVSAFYNLDTVTRDTAVQAGQAAHYSRNDSSGPGAAAVAYAAQHGVTVDGYDQTSDVVVVTTWIQVPGTWVAGPVMAAFAHKPLSQWWTTPLVIHARAQSQIQ
jgi:hypothetical protein